MRELKPTKLINHFENSSRTPHGVRELKRKGVAVLPPFPRRTPHGVRELKRTLVA